MNYRVLRRIALAQFAVLGSCDQDPSSDINNRQMGKPVKFRNISFTASQVIVGFFTQRYLKVCQETEQSN